MENLISIFHFGFFQNAFWAALLASITCGLVGTYIVSRRIVFISGGITHASFGGIGLGYFLGINPILGALVFGVLSALGIEFFTRKADVREDSAIAMLWAFGMAIGIIFVYLTPGYAPNLMSYLFGNILTVSHANLLFMGLIALVVIGFFITFFRMILFVSFDEEFALTNNAPVRLFNLVLISLVALTIVMNIRVVGIILVMSLLTIPQAISNIFTRDFGTMMILSVIFAFIGSMGGLLFSYSFNIPSGAAIIFALVILFGILKLISVGLKRVRE
ncbi:metal ABC transporter permease [Prolixibacter sp. SD074]|jgi:zinc transport system permease protein|uniref:metal ABC transporter permease n=1 Tax=Prolixibacter sp. SD074 TaxID=2652391 RepID=UPI00126EE2F6|nr:metal ABC transporter permease [Prolixibacter sp. SD074]GET30286.1 membrane protein [Prolixibacter sp. SD074]